MGAVATVVGGDPVVAFPLQPCGFVLLLGSELSVKASCERKLLVVVVMRCGHCALMRMSRCLVRDVAWCRVAWFDLPRRAVSWHGVPPAAAGEYVTLRDRPVVLPTDVEVLETIERDIHRTFPLHAMFSEVGGPGQQVLLRVLRAYAQHDKRVRGWVHALYTRVCVHASCMCCEFAPCGVIVHLGSWEGGREGGRCPSALFCLGLSI